MDVSAVELQRALRGADYPAYKDDLIDLARRNHADDDILEALRRLEDVEFAGPDEVDAALDSAI